MHLKRTHKLKAFGLPHVRKLLFQNIRMLPGLCLLSIALSACSLFPQTQDGKKTESTLTFPDTPGKQDMLIAPPDSNDNASRPGQGMMPNGLPALQALKGVKVEQLFSQNIHDTNQRFDRLENVVLNLSREFEALKPAIIRLVAIEADIQQLIDLLETTLQDAPPAAPIATNKKADSTRLKQPVPDAAPAQVTMAKSDRAFIRRLRIGRHDSFTRIVIDADRTTPHNVELDNQEKIIIIELPEAGWKGLMSKELGRSPVIKSYSVQPMNNGAGSRVIVALKDTVKVIRDKVIPPSETPDFRIFIDISSLAQTP